MKRVPVMVVAVLLMCGAIAAAQQTIATNTNVAVPPLVNFSGTLSDPNGRPLTGNVAVTFSLYSEPTGGAALWMESQNVQPDGTGRYTVMLGSTSSTGLAAEIFVAGQAHWLGVQVQGQEEAAAGVVGECAVRTEGRRRADLGGVPPSAFVLAAPPTSTAAAMPEAASPTAATTVP